MTPVLREAATHIVEAASLWFQQPAVIRVGVLNKVKKHDLGVEIFSMGGYYMGNEFDIDGRREAAI